MSTPINRFQFGGQTISTRVFMMAPRAIGTAQPWTDITAAMDEQPRERSLMLKVLPAGADAPSPPDQTNVDPFAGIEV